MNRRAVVVTAVTVVLFFAAVGVLAYFSNSAPQSTVNKVANRATTTAPPATSVSIPQGGAILSGTTLLGATATSATSVEFLLFGGSYGWNAPVICTTTPTYFGYLCNWDTTTVPNGSYYLASDALNSGGSTLSTGVSVTVANPPITSVGIPASNTTLSGTSAVLDAAASNGATSVDFWVFGGSYGSTGKMIATATPSIYGWLAGWDTTTVPNATYSLESQAFNAYGSAFSQPIAITTATMVPANIPSNCSADAAPALSTWLNGLSANSSVIFPASSCYTLNSTLTVHATTGLSINGAGTQFVQSAAPANVNPIILLMQNTNLTITNLTESGAFNGSNGGAGQEKNMGLELEADHGVTITNSTVSNVQGDFINLQAPFDTTNGDISLNSGITIDNDTFTTAGYHGIVVEAANGATFNNDTFTNMAVDAIDFEYDTYSTVFDTNGNPLQAAQDNVSITNNTFSNFNDDFFSQLQGQLPGVQSQNITISGNTINAPSPLMEVNGTNPYLTPSQYWNQNLTITNNTGLQSAISTHGAGAPGTEATMQIQAVVGLTISGNNLPLATSNGPYLSVLQAFENQSMTITGNNFSGAYSILQPGSSSNSGSTPCNNKYGVSGSQTDATC